VAPKRQHYLIGITIWEFRGCPIRCALWNLATSDQSTLPQPFCNLAILSVHRFLVERFQHDYHSNHAISNLIVAAWVGRRGLLSQHCVKLGLNIKQVNSDVAAAAS